MEGGGNGKKISVSIINYGVSVLIIFKSCGELLL